MKKKENRLFGFLMAVAVVGLFVTVAVVGLFGLATGQAQGGNTFSGDATGIIANVTRSSRCRGQYHGRPDGSSSLRGRNRIKHSSVSLCFSEDR